MSIYGFNPGYSLSSMNLNEIPIVQRQQQLIPSILSMNGPTLSLQQATAVINNKPSANVGQHNLSLSEPTSSNTPQLKCRNLNLDAKAAGAGAAQCIDKEGLCYPPINMRCPVNTVFLDQFSGASAGTPSSISYSMMR
jgi:hypothetical protein